MSWYTFIISISDVAVSHGTVWGAVDNGAALSFANSSTFYAAIDARKYGKIIAVRNVDTGETIEV